MRRTLLALALLTACTDSELQKAREADTTEAYEAYIAAHPESSQVPALKARIVDLRYRAADKAEAAPLWADFLAQHGDDSRAATAKQKLEETAWRDARKLRTRAAVDAYLGWFPDGPHSKDAKAIGDVIDYLPLVTIGELATRRVNMANDPEGPLDGWEVSAPVTNTGPRTLDIVEIGVDYLAGDRVAQTDIWWVVAKDLGGFPVPPDMLRPMITGEPRPFVFTTAEQPEGFEGSFGLRVTSLRFRQ